MASSGDGEDTSMHGQITNINPIFLPQPQSQQPGGLGFGAQSQQPSGLFTVSAPSSLGFGAQSQQSSGLFAQQPQPQQPSGGLFAPQSQSKRQSPLELENAGLSPVSPPSGAAGPITYRNPMAEDESLSPGLGSPLLNKARPKNKGKPPVAAELSNNSSGQQTSSHDPQAEIKRILQCRPNEWYTILGVSDTCSTEEAHQAYKRLALMIHPDRCKLERATDAAACK